MEKFDIAIDARMINASGIGTYLQNILPGICKNYKTALIGKKELLEEYKCEVIHFDAPIYSIKETITLPFKIPKCKIFWSPHFNVPIFKNRAEHTISTIHDVFHLAFHSTLPKEQKIYAKLFYNLAVNRSSKVITVSNFSKQEIIRYTSAEKKKISVIYNGVNQEDFSQSFNPPEKLVIRARYNLPQNYILFVGNIKPHKNLNNLVSALGMIFKNNKDLFLVIVGKKEGFITGDNQLTQLIEKNKTLKDRIKFTGFVDQNELPFIYQEACLFVFPSTYEGFGLPPLEAMAANTLAIVSKAGALPEVCKTGALYFDPYDIEDIKRGIENALHIFPEEREKINQEALNICKIYTWKKSIQEHISLFNELLKN